MARPFVGGVKTRIQKVPQKNGDIYIFERSFEYVKELKKTIDRGKKLIGKIPAGSATGEIVPTRPLKKKTKRVEIKTKTDTTVEFSKVGLSDLMQWVAKESGVQQDLLKVFDKGTAQKIDTVARFWATNQAAHLTRIELWQKIHTVPCETILDKAAYHNLFSELGYSDTEIQAFFKARMDRCPTNGTLALDSTTVSTYSTLIKSATKGYNKDGDGLDTVKLVCLFSIERGEPVAFAKQPGNMADIGGIAAALAQLKGLGTRTIELITDRGYTSWDNIYRLIKSHTKFLTAISKNNRLVREALEKNRSKLSQTLNICPWDHNIKGITIPLQKSLRVKGRQNAQTKRHRLYLHLFLSREITARDEDEFIAYLLDLKDKLENKVKDISSSASKEIEKYLTISTVGRGGRLHVNFNEKECSEAQKNFGYFALISNKAEGAFEALKKYRLREKVEEAFKETKGCLDGHRCRVWSDETLKGRQFCRFVSLIYHSFLIKKIREVKEQLKAELTSSKVKIEDKPIKEKLLRWLQSMSLQQILDCFDCVELTKWKDQKGGSVKTIVSNTERDNLLLQLLGVKGYETQDKMMICIEKKKQ